MAALYEIDRAILECVDPETGEVEDIELLNELLMERDEKIENVACWIKNLNAEAEALKEERDKLTERLRVKEQKAESLKHWLAYHLDGRSLNGPACP